MVDNEVVITYKRKRFSSQSDLSHGTKALKSSPKSTTGISPRRSSPRIELDIIDEKLNKDYSRCFKCGNFDVDENLLRCGCCSETHHFHCMNAPLKKTAPQRKWQCPICHRRNDSLEAQHYESGRGRQSKTEEAEMEPMVLCSRNVSLSIKFAGGCSRKASSSVDSSLKKSADSIQMDCTDDCTDDKSGPSSKFPDRDDVKPNPICSNLPTEIKYSSGCPEGSMITLNSDKTDERSKEKCKTPLITFSRRVKRKREGTGMFTEQNSKAEEKQCSSTTLRGHAAESNCIYEGSSPICSFKDQSASAVVLLEQAEMASIEKDPRLKVTPVGHSEETKIAGDNFWEANISNQNPVPSQPSKKDKSNSFMEVAATDFINNSILIQDDKKSDSAKIISPVQEESRNELATMNSEKTDLPYDVAVERKHPFDPVFSVAPPAFACKSNVESSIPSIDVVAGNLPESQNSSPPSCPIALVDEEADGRGKELEWLEDLDRVLQNKKKNRDTCSFIEQGGISCRQASSGWASSTAPAKSSVQSTYNQGASPECMNQLTPLQGKVFLSKLGDPGCEKQKYEETSIGSSLYTNFLGITQPLNHGEHVGSTKDVQSMLAPSSSGVKDNVHVLDRNLPLNTSNETSFSLRYKQMVENGINGTSMLKERQCSAVNMFRRYTNEWSEDELDFLWVGVRRHGLNNWNAMLRDPRLHFLESRVAEDLAMQWDVEQRKLLKGTLLQPLRFHRADYSSCPIMDDALLVRSTTANQYGGSAWSHACSEFPLLTAETRLSLGDVYHQKRNHFRSSDVCVVSESSSTYSFLNSLQVGSPFPKAGIRHQMPISAQDTRYDLGQSTSQQIGEKLIHGHQLAGPSTTTSSNLPHWLKEVLKDTDVRPRGSSLPPVGSNAAHSQGLLSDDLRLKMPFPYNAELSAPPRDPWGRGILKRKSVGSGNIFGGSRINEVSSSPNEPLKVGLLPILSKTSEKSTLDVTITQEKNNIFNLNRISDLVVIDSDASSEETISDDQSIRPS